MTQHKTRLIETDFGKLEILVGYDETVIKAPIRVEECHGRHPFSEDEVTYKITAVEVIFPRTQSIDILPLLSEKQIEHIIDNLND